VKLLCIILLTLGHVLTMGVGHCRTVWFDEPGVTDHAGHDHALESRHHDAGRHASWLGDGHAHPPELPDHAHIVERDTADRVARAHHDVGPLLIAPEQYVPLAAFVSILPDGATPARLLLAEARLPHAVPPLPLAGRTANLLF
jgi:hypothetical protein